MRVRELSCAVSLCRDITARPRAHNLKYQKRAILNRFLKNISLKKHCATLLLNVASNKYPTNFLSSLFYTKRVDEEYALADDRGLEDFILQKTVTLHQDEQQVGEVIVLAHRYLPDTAMLQAEFYRKELPSDVFFENGLVRRGYTYQKLEISLGDSLQGIVLSKETGIILSHVENHFLVREKDMAALFEHISYQKQHREEFADYVAVGSSAMGFLGYDYQPAGTELKEKIFLRKGKEVDAIKKETLKNPENLQEEDCVYNGELFLRKKRCDDISITLGRTSFILQREGQGLYLRDQQIDCLKKVLEMY